jgi:hypothetical protein
LGYSKPLIIGIAVGMAVGAFVCYAFFQFSQISNLQKQVDQLQLENSQLRTNNTELLNTILEIQSWVSDYYINFTTTKVGKAIAIQSVTENAVFVQNVGEGTVELDPEACLYVNGALTPCIVNPADGILEQGWTAILTFANDLPTPPITIKVVTADGTYSEYTKTVP